MIPPGPRVVLVSGASSGIGRAFVRHASERGDMLCLLARDTQAIDRLAAELSGLSIALAADITDPDAVAGAVAQAHTTFGRIDALVHTAQVMAYGGIEDMPRQAFERTVDVAVRGTANLARAVLPILRAQGHGTIVVVNSLLGEITVPDMGAYCTAKWGQLALARTLQHELRAVHGVDLSIVSPGAVDTPIYDQAANYTGRAVGPPPPISSPEHVATVIERCLQRPRRHVEVGRGNTATRIGYRMAPTLYDRAVGRLAAAVVLRRPATPHGDGNIFTAQGQFDDLRGGWNAWGRRRSRQDRN